MDGWHFCSVYLSHITNNDSKTDLFLLYIFYSFVLLGGGGLAEWIFILVSYS